MTTPWISCSGPPIAADDPFCLHLIAADGSEDWGSAGDEQRLHDYAQQAGIPYTLITSPHLPPELDG